MAKACGTLPCLLSYKQVVQATLGRQTHNSKPSGALLPQVLGSRRTFIWSRRRYASWRLMISMDLTDLPF